MSTPDGTPTPVVILLACPYNASIARRESCHHGSPERMSFPRRKAGDRRGHLEHLLLLEDHPEGVGQDRLRLWVEVADRLPSLAALP